MNEQLRCFGEASGLEEPALQGCIGQARLCYHDPALHGFAGYVKRLRVRLQQGRLSLLLTKAQDQIVLVHPTHHVAIDEVAGAAEHLLPGRTPICDHGVDSVVQFLVVRHDNLLEQIYSDRAQSLKD